MDGGLGSRQAPSGGFMTPQKVAFETTESRVIFLNVTTLEKIPRKV